MSKLTIKRALLSVFDKTGIVKLAKFLSDMEVEILSTGGTYDELEKNGIKCVKVEDFTGSKEFFGGRVKTLHPLIHGGILSKRDAESDQIGIKTIDMVVVNLYPFEKIVESGEKNLVKLIEMIDIGGPTMLRSAAKNYKHVCSVCSPDYYDTLIDELKNGGISDETRFKLAISVFRSTAYYDAVISDVLDHQEDFVETMQIPLKKSLDLRYGENPSQKAGFYKVPGYKETSAGDFFTDGKLHGKELSYNNISDASAALRILSDLPDNSCVVLKHANPCGAASLSTTHDSFIASYEADKVSIFGGIVGLKGVIELKTAEILSDIFLEIIIAESFSDEAFALLSKKKNIRLMEYRNWKNVIFKDSSLPEIKRVIGGILVQDRDILNPYNEDFNIVTNAKPTSNQISDLKFAQTIVKHVKSNAIVVVKDNRLIGVGAGQMNRVTAAKIALDWAGEKSKGAVIGSDAFFPMDDTVRLAASRGINAIIQPGGSVKDADSIAACDELGISMIMTGQRHFLH